MATIDNSFDPLVRVRDLSISFRLDKRTAFEAVKNISFDIPRNTTVALVGESGSGKSVTSLAILGLLPPENSIVDPKSQIMYGGRNLLALSRGQLQDLRGRLLPVSVTWTGPWSMQASLHRQPEPISL